MHISLRWKILAVVVLTPAVLGAATLVTVHRNVTRHVNTSSIHESLNHSVAVFESMLQTRSRALVGGAGVIVQDPRFFSLLMLGSSQRDSRFRETVRGMAHDFSAITETDLFEVMDRRGHMLASVGTASSTRAAREAIVRAALKGRTVEAVLVEATGHYQVAATPVRAGGAIVGVLLLGAAIGPDLARELRSQMRCEVTFLSAGSVTGTTLSVPGDPTALVRTLRSLDLGPSANLDALGLLKVVGPRATYLTLVRRIPVSDPATSQIYVMQRSFDPETTFLHTMQLDMGILALIALGMALASALLFSNQILRPIQHLVRAAHEMERGNYQHPLDAHRGDELGYLMERFGTMREREHDTLRSVEQAARLKSEFLTLASHELRTPLSVLGGYRELLATGQLGPVTAKQAQALEAMQSFISRMTNIAEDAGRFARVQGERLVLEITRCDVEPLVRRAVGAALAAGARRAVAVDSQCDEAGESIDVDAEALEQALFHLVANAIRSTPDGGRVDVRASERDGRLRIEVEDRGIGMKADALNALLSHRPAVLDAGQVRSTNGLEFNTAGLGLGLSIVRSVVDAHDGTLHAESEPGHGTRIAIDLPMRRRAEMRDAA